jgi:hypothetical protein
LGEIGGSFGSTITVRSEPLGAIEPERSSLSPSGLPSDGTSFQSSSASETTKGVSSMRAWMSVSVLCVVDVTVRSSAKSMSAACGTDGGSWVSEHARRRSGASRS